MGAPKLNTEPHDRLIAAGHEEIELWRHQDDNYDYDGGDDYDIDSDFGEGRGLNLPAPHTQPRLAVSK
jgi:hypothetical protein